MSIRHIVLFELREGVSRNDPAVQRAAALSRSHPEHIDEIEDWWAGFDLTGRDISVDFMVMGSFATPRALERFAVHPHHRQGVGAWSKIANWHVIDVDEAESRLTKD